MSLVKVEHGIAVALAVFTRLFILQTVGQVERTITRTQAVERDKLAVHRLFRRRNALCTRAVACLRYRNSQLRPHKRLGKADLKRRLVGTVIDGVGGGGIEQPFKLRGHSYGARGIRRIVGNHAIRHGIQVHVTLDWLTLKLIP